MQERDEAASGAGDAAAAFEQLRSEVTVMRRAVEALPDHREANQPPDYTVTLGKIVKWLAEVSGRLAGIEGHPALKMTPDQHQHAIAQAGSGLMRAAAAHLY